MREFSVPATVSVAPEDNLARPVFTNAEKAPADVAFTRKVGSGWQDVTAREFADEVRALAKGLVASGIQVGDRVGLMSHTRYEWTLCDYAIWTAGAVTVPVYETSSPEQVTWYLGDSGAVGAFAEGPSNQEVLDEARADLPDVRTIWQFEAGGLEALKQAGAQVPDSEIDARLAAVGADDVATIIYTSGTTGRPKGCELTHRNIWFDVATTTDGLQALFNREGSTLLFLPLAHVFARLIQCGCVMNQVRMGHTADIKNLLPDLQTFQPTFLLSVPRVFEKVYNSAKQKAHADGKGRIFDQAEATAIAYSEALEDGGAGLVLRGKHALFDRLVYAKLRGAMGGKLENAISGGAPLGARLGHFYRGIGLPIFEGYGLTETAAGATVNLQDSVRIGTVGRPIPGCTVRIAEDGEVMLTGDNVFRGYWRNETATKEALDPDGWFHTGDLGQLDEDGFLKIIGRKKELIVTSGGKNVAPAVLEDRLRAHPLVSQCVVVGDQKPFIGCLVTIDEEALAGWKSEHGKPADASVADLREDDELRATVQQGIDDANRAVSKAEAIKAFRILPVDLTESGGQLTPSLKVKRAVVLEEFSGDVAAIYGD